MWSSSGDSSRQRPIRITVRDLDAERGPPLPPARAHGGAATAATEAATASPSTMPASAAAGGDAPPLSMGWLLRLFRSDFFDAWMAVTYLYRYRASRGVHDYLCNELYHLSDADLEAFLPQVCNLLVHHARDSPALERFVMDKCASSLHFAVQVYWFLQAAVEDAVRDANRDAEARCRLLRTRCETAAVNGIRHAHNAFPVASPSSIGTTNDVAAAAGLRDPSGPPLDLSSSGPDSATLMPSKTTQRQLHPASTSGSGRGGTNALHGKPPVAIESEADALLRMQPSDSSTSLDDIAKAGVAMASSVGYSARSGSRRPPELPRPHPIPSTLAVGNAEDDSRRNLPAPSIASDDATFGDSDDLQRVDLGDMDVESDEESKGSSGGEPVSSARNGVDRCAEKLEENPETANVQQRPEECSITHLRLSTDNTRFTEHSSPPRSSADESIGDLPNMSPSADGSALPFDPVALLTMKQERFDYFNDSLTIVKAFVRLSLALRDIPTDDRLLKLKEGLREVNDILRRRMAGESAIPLLPGAPAPEQEYVSKLGEAAALRSIHLPLSRAMSPALRILRVIADDAIILTSRTRVPYMLFVEVLPTTMLCCDQYLFCHHIISDLRTKGLPVPEHMSLASEHCASPAESAFPGPAAEPPTAASREHPDSRSTSTATSGDALKRSLATGKELAAAPSESPDLNSVRRPGDMSSTLGCSVPADSCGQAPESTSLASSSLRSSAPPQLESPSSNTNAASGLSPGIVPNSLTSKKSEASQSKPLAENSLMPSQDSLEPSPPGLIASSSGTLNPTSSCNLEKTPAERQRANVYKAVYGQPQHVAPFMDLDVISSEVANVNAGLSPESTRSVTSDDANKSREAALLAVYGELWSWKEERILSSSPFRGLRGAKLMPFIVKAGDDLRQEQLAIQLISQFQWIFAEESVDLYLRPFTVMSVSSDAGFVEVIPDAVSVHSLKKRTPSFHSLLDYFERAYGKIGSRSFREAQRRFIRSMAGYSLVSYFLQIKDRHNGNIMLSAEGHIIHIDFGFMLTNSPGAIKFENVPFKLTEEYLQVICARKSVQDPAETSRSEGYRYFQELFVLGLLAARKHYEKLTTLVEIMMEGTSMPCMSGGHSVVDSLRHRFSLGVSEEQCITHALGLIDESRLSWRSASYDKFQQMQNGYF